MPRKGENIYKRKDGRWEGRYIKGRTIEGKAVYGYVYAKSYREVKLHLQTCIATQATHPAIKHECTQVLEHKLFRDVAQEWFSVKINKVKDSTGNKYSNLLQSYIIPTFGSIPISRITNDQIEAGCNKLLISGGKSGTGLSTKTVSDILSVIRNILQYASQTGHVAVCDARSIHIRRNSKEMRVLSRSEQEQLCQYLYQDLNAYNIGILVCLFTGIRIGELCALQWEDISFLDQTIHVHRTMQRIQNKSGSTPKTKVVVTSPKSPCSIRRIPIPNELVKIMAAYKTKGTGYFLTNSTQVFVEPRTMQNKFKSAVKNSAIESANFHALRHTFATRCVELGFDVKSLSEILGHASVNITMNRYVHPSMDLKKENMQKLSELLAVK